MEYRQRKAATKAYPRTCGKVHAATGVSITKEQTTNTTHTGEIIMEGREAMSGKQKREKQKG